MKHRVGVLVGALTLAFGFLSTPLAAEAQKVTGVARAAYYLNAEDQPYNQLCWEVGRRAADWRMRSPSDDEWDRGTNALVGSAGGQVNGFGRFFVETRT